MRDLISFKKDLKNIIKKNNLCISKNPLGIDKLWPKSFIEKYYFKLFFNLLKNNNDINILELDTKNKYQLILWKKVFINSSIEEDSILRISNYKNKVKKFDLIIVNYLPQDKQNHLIKILKNIEERNIVVIENIYKKNFYLSKIFFLFIFTHDFIFEDYRLKRFIKNNCILTIRKKTSEFNPTKNFIILKKYITYVAIDMFFSLLNLF